MSDWPRAYEEHAPGIRAFLRRRLRHEETAEDLCQETFVRVMGAESSLREASRLRSYLYRTARNLMLNHLRRPLVVRVQADLAEELDLDATCDPRDEGPDSGVRLRELREHLQRSLAELGPEQRIAFELGVLGRVPYAEIAARTGWTLAKVKVNVFRARRRLTEELYEFREDRA